MPQNDYLDGFATYVDCLAEHADLAKRSYGATKEIRGALNNARKYCIRVAKALGAVINGRRWKPPKKQ